MRITQQTSLLVTGAALFTVFGAVLDLWFYTIGGLAVALYVGTQFFAFRSLEKGLTIGVHRRAQKRFVRQRREVTVDVTVDSNMDITGLFSDVIPDDVALVDGDNASQLTLSRGETATLRYTVAARGRADIRIEASTFTVKNHFFSQTLHFQSQPLEVRQSASVLTVESSDEARDGVGKDALSMNVTALHRSSTQDEFEVASLRPYAVDDPLNRIHWKASARLSQLMTKEFASELDVIARQAGGLLDEIAKEFGAVLYIVIDQSASMRAGAPGETPLDFAVNVASYLFGRAIKTGVYTGLMTYDDSAIVTDVPPGYSSTQSSTIVQALNTLGAHASRATRHHTKTGIVSTEVAQLQKNVGVAGGGEEEADTAYFRGLVAYVYEHAEGYHEAIATAPAFRALATSALRRSAASVVVVITDLHGDIDPLIEGLLLATGRGISTYVITPFAHILKPYDDRLVAAEDLYTSYETYQTRMSRLRTIPHVRLIPVDSPAYLASYLRKAKLGAMKAPSRWPP